MSDIKRLPLKTLETWKRKAAALDEAVEYLRGLDLCGRCLRVQQILQAAIEQVKGDGNA